MEEDKMENGFEESEASDVYLVAERDVGVEVEEEEEEVEEEGEDNIEERGSVVGFQDEVNPLEFVEDEAAGDQLYKQFERIEYEALAKRKRDADDFSEGSSKKARLEEATLLNYEEMLEAMTYGGRRRRRSRKQKIRGRRKGSKNKLNPEVSRKLGDATLHYARGDHEEAIKVLNEVVQMAPNLSYPYHRLASIYNEIGAKKKATACYMIAAFLSPKDASLWERLVYLSIEQGYIGQAWYCLSKAITADPKDISLRKCRASLSMEAKDYEKAAESYDQIFRLCPNDFDTLKNAIMLYKRCGKVECAMNILKWYIKEHGYEANPSMVDMLVSLCVENHGYSEALQHIENAKRAHSPGTELPVFLTIKEGICSAHLGDMEKAEICFSLLQQVDSADHIEHFIAVGDTLMELQHYESALKYYRMLEWLFPHAGFLYLKIARCCMALKRNKIAIEFFYKVLHEREDDIENRLALSSLLLEEGRDSEAIDLLLPPPDAGLNKTDSSISMPWWLSGKIKLKLSSIYKSKGMHEAFVDAIHPLIHETLLIEKERRKVLKNKRLSRKKLEERVKVLDDSQVDFVFCNFRRPAKKSDLSKGTRAKKLLQSKATEKEKKKSAALAAGVEWRSDESDEEDEAALQVPIRESPLPDLFKDGEHYNLIKDLCHALSSLGRYDEAVKIIKLTLKLTVKKFPNLKKEKFYALGSEIAFKLSDPSGAAEFLRFIIRREPQNVAAWNSYFKIFSRCRKGLSEHKNHKKFLDSVRGEQKKLVHPMVVNGNLFTALRQYQDAARWYLRAYKRMPESPLINLCAGTALINLACGHRLQNKHQCMAQGLAFLYNNLRICGGTREALYNVARGNHQVGLVTLAASYYEKVLAIEDKEFPYPEHSELPLTKEGRKPDSCDLRREAAYNLHLIYKRSGATDLARQVLKDYCTI